MNGRRAEGPGVIYRVSPPANEDNPAMVTGVGSLLRPRSGWDPYEVWRTRVKGPPPVMPESERGPLRLGVKLALWRAAVARDLSRGCEPKLAAEQGPAASGMLRT
jgi:hypothetical protein